MLRLLLSVQRDQLHTLGPAVLHSTVPVEVVSMVPPGEQVALTVELIVSLGSWR